MMNYDDTILVIKTIGKLFFRIPIMVILLLLYKHTFGETSGLTTLGLMMTFAILFLTIADILKDLTILRTMDEKPTNKTIPTKRKKGYIIMHKGRYYASEEEGYSEDIEDAIIYDNIVDVKIKAVYLEEGMGNKYKLSIVPIIR